VYHFFDKVDGEIARFYQKFSISGVFLDEIGHTLSFAGIFTGLGFHLVQQNTDHTVSILAATVIGAISMIMVRQNKSMGCLLFSQYVLEQPRLMPEAKGINCTSSLTREAIHVDRRSSSSTSYDNKKKILVLVRNAVLVVSQFTIMLIFILIGLFIEILSGSIVCLIMLIKIAAVLQLLVLLALILINYKVNVAAECLRLDSLIKKQLGVWSSK
jgi:hypothetical protein